MKKKIACCGVDCAACDAYVATLNNDDELRRTTAERWARQLDVPVEPEYINCDGCQQNRRPAFGVLRFLRYPHLLFGKAARDLRRV